MLIVASGVDTEHLDQFYDLDSQLRRPKDEAHEVVLGLPRLEPWRRSDQVEAAVDWRQ